VETHSSVSLCGYFNFPRFVLFWHKHCLCSSGCAD